MFGILVWLDLFLFVWLLILIIVFLLFVVGGALLLGCWCWLLVCGHVLWLCWFGWVWFGFLSVMICYWLNSVVILLVSFVVLCLFCFVSLLIVLVLLTFLVLVYLLVFWLWSLFQFSVWFFGCLIYRSLVDALRVWLFDVAACWIFVLFFAVGDCFYVVCYVIGWWWGFVD